MNNTRLSPRALALAAALALAFGVAACGDSGDDASTASSGANAAGGSTDPQAESQAVRKAMEDLEDDLYSRRLKAYCAGLTEQARDEQGGKSCEKSLAALVPEPLSQTAREMYKTRILKVQVDGDEATLFTRESDNESKKVTFVKVDGKWLLTDNRK